MNKKKNVHPPAQCPQVCIPKPNESKAHGMDEEKIMPRINLGNNEVGLYPGGEGYPTKFYMGRLRSEVHPSPLDRPHLTKIGYPIRLI